MKSLKFSVVAASVIAIASVGQSIAATKSNTKGPRVWSGDCCNPSGICITVAVTPVDLRLISDGRGGSVNRVIIGQPKWSEGSWKFGGISWNKPTAKNDGVLRLDDGREFMCFAS